VLVNSVPRGVYSSDGGAGGGEVEGERPVVDTQYTVFDENMI